MPIWIFFALLGGFSSVTANFFHRFILKDGDDPTAYAWFYETFLFVVAFVYALFNFHLIFSIRSFLFLLGLGFVEFISVYLYMKMHSYSHLSISTIISRARMIWVAIIAFFIFGESLQVSQYIGILVILVGLALVTSPKKIFEDKGVWYAHATSISTAFVNIFLKLSSTVASTPIVMASMTIPSVVLFPLLIKNSKKRIIQTFKVNLHLKLLAGGANVLSSLFLVLALSQGSATIVASLYQSMMTVGVLAGIVFFHERQNIAIKLIGATITILGVFMLLG